MVLPESFKTNPWVNCSACFAEVYGDIVGGFTFYQGDGAHDLGFFFVKYSFQFYDREIACGKGVCNLS